MAKGYGLYSLIEFYTSTRILLKNPAMKKNSMFLVILTISALTIAGYGQNNCIVLLPGISGSYTGSCKKGLADGKGEASGVDRYVGDFKKGYPDGVGTYTWQTGERYSGEWKKGKRDGEGEFISRQSGIESVLSGTWKDDQYVGKKAPSPYVIGYRNNVGRINFTKISETPLSIRYKFSRSGETSSFLSVTNLLLRGSSGTENISTSYTGYENVIFPFEGNVKFQAPNTLNTSTLGCELRFAINEPGYWLVTIYY